MPILVQSQPLVSVRVDAWNASKKKKKKNGFKRFCGQIREIKVRKASTLFAKTCLTLCLLAEIVEMIYSLTTSASLMNHTVYL